MKIAHLAPFAPFRCGLYEAARDMARADALRGHKIVFIDTGTIDAVTRKRAPQGVADQVDPRGGWPLTTSAVAAAFDADIWVCHDGVPDAWLARTQVPVVWMMHGRPLACFRPEQERPEAGDSYTLISELSTWPRVKALVSFWDEHLPYWSVIVPKYKLFSTIDPPIDGARYRPEGLKFEIKPEKRGEWNLLICDSWREDEDIFEVANAAFHAAKQVSGVKVHFWAVESTKQKPWQPIWRAMDTAGCLGMIEPRTENMDRVYRAMDLVVTPHRIGTRVIGEALCCGTAVVAGLGCRYTKYRGNPHYPEAMADAIVDCISDLAMLGRGCGGEVGGAAELFDLALYGERIERIYEHALIKTAETALCPAFMEE